MRQAVTPARLNALMVELGQQVRGPGTVYLTGGATALLFGWRHSTVDVDLKPDPEPPGFFEAIAVLKDSLDVNIEIVAPHDFIPALPQWRERSPMIAREGRLTFRHYDLYSQALSKIERNHARDAIDVRAMCELKLIDPGRLRELFQSIRDRLIRFPAIDAASFERRVLRLQMRSRNMIDWQNFPGAELIEPGLADVAAGRETVESLLIEIGAVRMREAGLVIPPIRSGAELPEMRLYLKLGSQFGKEAHSQYNALLRRLVQFQRALERANRGRDEERRDAAGPTNLDPPKRP